MRMRKIMAALLALLLVLLSVSALSEGLLTEEEITSAPVDETVDAGESWLPGSAAEDADAPELTEGDLSRGVMATGDTPDLEYGGHIYRVIEHTATFADAEAECEAMGGHLATITSAKENAALTDYLVKYYTDGAFMIGLYDEKGSDGTWSTWVTGESAKYKNWGAKQPDQTGQKICAINADANDFWGWDVGEWDNGKDGDYWFICEWDGKDKVKKMLTGATVTLSKTEYTYNGKAKKPTATVTLDGKTLVKGTDYTVAYENNTDVGTATVRVTGKGNYGGTATATFRIVAPPIVREPQPAGVKLTHDCFTVHQPVSGDIYNVDEPIHVKIGRMLFNPPLTDGGFYKERICQAFVRIDKPDGSAANYGTAYTKQVWAENLLFTPVEGYFWEFDFTPSVTGTYTMYLGFDDAYRYTEYSDDIYVGCLTFKVVKPIDGAKVTVKSQVYTGEKLKPDVTVKLDGKKLKKDRDYTVKYTDNKKIGKATVTVKGKGNYTGTASQTFNIVPPVVTGLKLTAGTKQLTASWDKVAGVTGYQLQYGLKSSFSGSKKVKVQKAATVETLLKSLKAKAKYYVRIRAYKTVDGVTYYSAWSAAKAKTTR